MIVVFLSLDDAETLANLLRQRGVTNVLRQLNLQLPTERVLPSDALPVLSVRYGDETNGIDVFNEGLAEAMYLGMQDAAQRHRADARERYPLLDQVPA